MAASADLDRVKIWQDLEIASGGRLDVNGDWYIGGTKVSATAAELNALYALGLVAAELGVLDGVTAGTVTGSKAVVVSADKDIGDFRNFDAVNIDVGTATGTAGTIDIFPGTGTKGKWILSFTAQTGNTNVTMTPDAMGQATTIHFADPVASASYVVQSTAALTLAEVDVLDAVTKGTAAASKAVVLDSSKDCIGLGRLTQGAFSSTAQGSGLAINPTYTAALRTYADDAGAALTPSGAVPDLRVTLGRYLVTANQSAVNIRVWGSMGQVKVYDALVNGEQIGGVNGRLEVVQSAGTTTLAGYGVSAGVCGIFATAGTTLVNTNHVAAGVAAIADIKGTCTQTGIVAGFYVGKYDTTNWSDATTRAAFSFGIVIDADASTQPVRIGNWVGSGAKSSAVPFGTGMNFYNDGQLDVVAAFGESNADLTGTYSAKVGRFRHLVSNSAAGTTVAMTASHETYGLVGQLVAKNATLTHLHAGLMGTFEGNTEGVVSNGAYDCSVAAVMARIGGGATITATKPVCGFSSVWHGAALASGTSLAFAACATSTTPWTVGLYMPVGSVHQGIRIGHWKTTGGTGNAIAFDTATDSADTGQLDIVACYGESTADLTSAISAKVGRFRHLVSGSSLSVAHETYGLMGQLCVKGTTLTHLHAGLVGTFEGTGAAVVSNSSYTYGVAAVMARVGAGANIAGTTCVSGFSAMLLHGNVASGTSSAFSCSGASTGDWDYGMSLKDCTRAFNFVGACVDAKQAGAIDSTHSILIHVDGQPYAIPVHAVGA